VLVKIEGLQKPMDERAKGIGTEPIIPWDTAPPPEGLS